MHTNPTICQNAGDNAGPPRSQVVRGPRRVAYVTDLVMFVLVTIINLQIQTLMYDAAVLNSNDEVKA